MLHKNKLIFFRTLLVFCIINSLSFVSIFADNKQNTAAIKWGGFVRNDMYWDSRATTGARDNLLLFFPKNKALNVEGKDINAVPSFHWANMLTRLNATISAPDFLLALVTGFVEVEFIGQADAQTNVLRMRHAYLDLDWGLSKLTIGQNWHPMFMPETMPLSLAAAAGAPISPLARNPQVRYQQRLARTFFMQGTAFIERDMVSSGPDGGSVEYQKNTLLPAFNLLFKYKTLDNKFIVGAGGTIKTIQPIKLVNRIETNSQLMTFATNVFLGLATSDFTLRLNGFYGNMMSDMLMPGGYGVSEYTKYNEAVSLPSKYTAFNNVAATVDLGYAIHKNLKIGVFAGMNMNLGTNDKMNITDPYWTSFNNMNIDKLIRIAPRLTYQSGKIQFGAEAEYTQADYGKEREQIDNKWRGKWKTTDEVNNIRFLFTTTFLF